MIPLSLLPKSPWTLVVILMFAMIGMTALSFNLMNRVKEVTEEKAQIKLFAQRDSAKLTTYYMNRLGQQVAKTQAITMASKDVNDLRNTDQLAFLNKFDALNKKLNNLESAVKTTAKVVGDFKIKLGPDSVVTVIHGKDTTKLKVRPFDNHNKWFEIKGEVYPDSVHVKPMVTVPLETVDYWQRKKILFFRIGKKTWFHESTSPNPYVHITENTVIRVEKRK